uniref:Replication protein A 70 kDa DNA-binding subunit B/D first OB fold domain-containing protein n=1 Tax=Lactuca sativa TaxID=4236 RepID=A0A9R1UZL3_LACSA|nr:hypothetical protein LSAT_V11C700368070 [Lactuca sativa]
MTGPNVTFVADVDVTRDDLTFKLRVINLWKKMALYNKDKIYSIEIILIDEKGNKIQAIVSTKNIYKFKDILKNGHAFYIKFPVFASQRMGGLRLNRLHHKLTFVHNSILMECHDFSRLVVAFGDMLQDNSDMKKHKLNIQIQDANYLNVITFEYWGLSLISGLVCKDFQKLGDVWHLWDLS